MAVTKEGSPMTKITPTTGAAFAVLLALIAGFALLAPNDKADAATAPGFRVDVACYPLTSAQGFRNYETGKYELVKDGTPQTCRVRIRNYDRDQYDSQGNLVHEAKPITGITFDRPTPNTLTERYQYVKYRSNGTVYNPMGGPLLDCDLSGCDPFDLAPGESVIIYENSTFNAYQDGRGLTTATATGTYDGEVVTASGTEQASLP